MSSTGKSSSNGHGEAKGARRPIREPPWPEALEQMAGERERSDA